MSFLSHINVEWDIPISQWREGVGFLRDFQRESLRDGMGPGIPCLGMGRSPIPSRGLSRGKSLRKPTPSRHWLIRITFYIALPLGEIECTALKNVLSQVPQVSPLNDKERQVFTYMFIFYIN